MPVSIQELLLLFLILSFQGAKWNRVWMEIQYKSKSVFPANLIAGTGVQEKWMKNIFGGLNNAIRLLRLDNIKYLTFEWTFFWAGDPCIVDTSSSYSDDLFDVGTEYMLMKTNKFNQKLWKCSQTSKPSPSWGHSTCQSPLGLAWNNRCSWFSSPKAVKDDLWDKKCQKVIK